MNFLKGLSRKLKNKYGVTPDSAAGLIDAQDGTTEATTDDSDANKIVIEIENFVGIDRFADYEGIPQDARNRAGFEGIFWSNEGTIVHKWHHYLPIYERYFAPYKSLKPRFLEIGVSKGGSLSLWREYFGPDAVIFGIDIDPSCAALTGC